jgi:hypothetical protein
MAAKLTKHTGRFPYGGKDISFDFWVHARAGATPDTVVFLGTGQNGRIPKWVAEASPSGVVVIGGAPHWIAHPSAHDLHDFMCDFSRVSYEAALAACGMDSAHVVAHSQAAPGAVRLAVDRPQMVRNLALISPLGFGASTFGNTPLERFRNLQKRSLASLLQIAQSPLYDWRNLYAGVMILRAILSEAERGASTRKYSSGLSYDILEDCRDLLKVQKQAKTTTTLVLCGKDKIFTPKEILNTLKMAQITDMKHLTLPKVSHSMLAIRGGRDALLTAVKAVRAPLS